MTRISMNIFGRLCLLSFILVLSMSAGLMAQQTPPIVTPNILPPSPEATALGKYGDLPVGMFTGTPNFSIDLDKVASKHLSVPISISYSTNGIKVDEVSSRVGMSWVLNCGGMVSRTVYSKPDFTGSTDAPSPPDMNFATANTDTPLVYWMKSMAAGLNDMQMDAFNYNFNGYSGKFFISPTTGLPIIAPYANINIQYSFSQTNWNFKITTPDGTIYYFGGTGAIEETEDLSTCLGSNHQGEIPTAWYLTKIQYPNDPSDSIVFIYSADFYSYPTGVNETVTYIDPTSNLNFLDCATVNGLGYNQPCTCGPSPFIYGNPTTTNGQLSPQFCENVSGISGVCLEQITDGKYNLIKFHYIAKPDVAGDSLVSNITMYNDQNGQRLRSFNFLYTQGNPSGSFAGLSQYGYASFSVSLPRPFLSEVDELDSTGVVVKPWKFGYTNFSNLAPRLSYSQDYWGYFNGIVNSSLIPFPAIGYNYIAPTLIGNRNADYNSAGLGMLNSITYPTGGYTGITYEGNTLDSSYSIGAQTIIGFQTGAQSIEVKSSSPTNATFTVNKAISVTITETLSCSGSCPAESDNAYWGELVLNGTDILQATYQKYNERQEEVENIVTMTLQPGTYGFDVLPNAGYSMDMLLQANATDTFYITNDAVQVPVTSSSTFTGGGMRVKRVVSYDPVTNDSTIKHYYYDQMILPYMPAFYGQLVHIESFWQPQIYTTGCALMSTNVQAVYNQFFSTSLANQYGTGTALPFYPKVRESFGDNFENGGIIHQYGYSTFTPIQYVWNAPLPNVAAPNLNWQNGLETFTEQFKMNDAVQVPVQAKTMSYTIDPRNTDTINQFVVQQVGNSSSGNILYLSQNYNVAEVSYITQWQYLNQQITQDYDVNGNPTVADTVNYFYDNATHAQLTRTQSKDSKGRLLQDTIKYVGDVASVNGLTAAQISAVGELQSQYQIANVLENDQARNGTLMSRQQTDYMDWGGGLVLPDTVKLQIAANPMESRLYYSGYDNEGDILTYSKAGDLLNSYIWDYKNTLPIAQVINAAQFDVAYTSFEADGSGNWTIPDTTRDRYSGGITGNLTYKLTSANSITKSGLNSATTYIVGFWVDSAGTVSVNGSTTLATARITLGTWTYKEAMVTGSTTVTIGGSGVIIDELRLCPKGSLITTYTYAPLIGITSKCDASSRLTYYSYDNLERLKLIKDQYGNILKRYDYEYQTTNQ